MSLDLHREPQDPVVRDLYRKLIENEAAIVNGLDAWTFDATGFPPDDIVERRKQRAGLDGQMLALVTTEIEQAVRTSQEASDQWWNAIQEYASVSGLNYPSVDLAEVWRIVEEARAESHAAFDRLKDLVRAELRGNS